MSSWKRLIDHVSGNISTLALTLSQESPATAGHLSYLEIRKWFRLGRISYMSPCVFTMQDAKPPMTLTSRGPCRCPNFIFGKPIKLPPTYGATPPEQGPAFPDTKLASLLPYSQWTKMTDKKSRRKWYGKNELTPEVGHRSFWRRSRTPSPVKEEELYLAE